jgi:hypothetical protein
MYVSLKCVVILGSILSTLHVSFPTSQTCRNNSVSSSPTSPACHSEGGEAIPYHPSRDRNLPIAEMLHVFAVLASSRDGHSGWNWTRRDEGRHEGKVGVIRQRSLTWFTSDGSCGSAGSSREEKEPETGVSEKTAFSR